MSATDKTFKNNAVLAANELAALDANGIKNENNNLIERSEMALDIADHSQTARAVNYMSLRSNSYESILNVNTIELSPYTGSGGQLESPSQYFDSIIRFISPVTSDGISAFQIKIGALASKPFTLFNGALLSPSNISVNQWAEARYDSSSDSFILILPIASNFASFYSVSDLTIIYSSLFNLDLDGTAENSGDTILLNSGSIVVNRRGIYQLNFDFDSNLLLNEIINPENRVCRCELILYLNGNPANLLYNAWFDLEDINNSLINDGTGEFTMNFSIFSFFELSALDELTIAFRNTDSDGNLVIFGGKIENRVNIEFIKDT